MTREAGPVLWSVGVPIARLRAELNDEIWPQVEKWLNHFRQPDSRKIEAAVEECAVDFSKDGREEIAQIISQCWLGVTSNLDRSVIS